MSGREPDIYSFFKEFKEYKECEGAMKNAFSRDKLKTTCDSFSTGVQKFGNERANDVCVKFKILCKVIQSKKKNPNTENLNDIDFAYLNYWLNSLSRNTTINHDLTVDQFQKEMSDREYEFVSVTFDKKLYDIKLITLLSINNMQKILHSDISLYHI
ncbi:PIR Superfamily Protein [Plasmodium ovale wallikeri]|uniref:PIR Superfamily Protein n=1 Tax=Plasmodium ovale wallikeri TaxID=864142 RepID=A0A1A9AIL1_PLAOA|nr:PIR Superfamily Protein [Plasmodium ovale wallikeri]